MAGDWMKIELELPDKPEVHAIAGMLNIDPDSVVGKLIRVWQWFDKHTTDGNAYGVTYSLPDRISGVTGFGEAMAFVGWLEQHDKTLVMPKFDRHTSASAKQRALTAKRVANHKSKSNGDDNDKGNDDSVSDALPREEKRRDIYTPEFERFWLAYPKKASKQTAYKSWKKISPEDYEPIHAGLALWNNSRQWASGYIHEPATWLNQRRWEDEVETKQQRSNQVVL